MNFDAYESFIFDLDGCLYSGDTPYPGAADLISYLLKLEKQVFFLSNNSTETSEQVLGKLSRLGFQTGGTTAIVATELIGKYIYENHGLSVVSAIGSGVLENSLRDVGHQVVALDGDRHVDFIVLGRDEAFSYHKLTVCVNRMFAGARLITTNPDLYHPGLHGLRVPETGALLAAISAVKGENQVESIGKPHPYPFQTIVNLTNADRSKCIMIGDNLLTDIKGGAEFGMDTVWISHENVLPADTRIQPDFIYASIAQFYDFLKDELHGRP
ncbi:HAD-IIA family hydrolase [Cohnella cellulosilytica]|uniref:HAD-IIA family hydrolase n=1 Tax=Cohnella cellulosilytica TaxID=986710 RepID=A0ABW2F3N7_9BACL